eukprot:COSAG01_NODE_380_length_17862_cov_20.427212_18_plen_170_part_00
MRPGFGRPDRFCSRFAPDRLHRPVAHDHAQERPVDRRRAPGDGESKKNGYLMSRRGCSLPAIASGFDPHRASITSRFGQVLSYQNTINPKYENTNRPPIDGVRMVPVSPSGYDAAMIRGRYKIVTGHQGGSGFWTGPIHPNGTADPKRNGSACGAFACCEGCLYDIQKE